MAIKKSDVTQLGFIYDQSISYTEEYSFFPPLSDVDVFYLSGKWYCKHFEADIDVDFIVRFNGKDVYFDYDNHLDFRSHLWHSCDSDYKVSCLEEIERGIDLNYLNRKTGGTSSNPYYIWRDNNLRLFKRETGFVYLLKSASSQNMTKIGISKRPESRLHSFGTSIPFGAIVSRLYPVSIRKMRKFESFLHNAFASKRKNGEWFDLSSEDILAIDTFMHGHGIFYEDNLHEDGMADYFFCKDRIERKKKMMDVFRDCPIHR